MINRKPYLRKVRSLGYRFRKQQRRTVLYRKANGDGYLLVPRSGPLDEVYVRSALRQNGLAPEEIDAFIAEHSERDE